MTYKKTPKNAKIFLCNECNFTCSKLSDFERHKMTAKHKILTNTYNKNAENAENGKIQIYACECGKQYKHRQSLNNHKKKCINKNTNESNIMKKEDIDYKNLLIQAMKQMREQQEDIRKRDELMIQMVNKIGSTTNNINTSFNINMFLNEKCKNAINFSEFIDRIEVSQNDLENNAQLGFVKGITKILMDNLNQLTLYERPIHCTDEKRETLYIKDNDKWDKECSDKKLEGAIQEVSRKSIGSLLQWKQTNPEYENMDSYFSNQCLVIQKQSLAGEKKNVYYPKIIHNIAKESIINKM